MRRVKKTFNYTAVKVTDKETNKILMEEKRSGNVSESKVAVDYIKEHGYNPNMEISCKDVSETYAMSAEDFMLHGEEILAEQTDENESEGN